MNDDEAIRFINSLVKNLQVLCHGSVEFKQKVEVIGHLYLNVDSDIKFDYVVNEKVCKNEESSTTFVSNSFHAGPKKSLADRKKELEEELAKLQQEQSKQNQVSIESRRHSASNRRKVPFNSQISNQAAFTRQSPMRSDGYPLSPLPEHTFKPNLDSPVAKIPRLSFEDMHNYDINEMNSSMRIQKNSSVHDGERVFIPTSISDLAQSSLSSTEETKPNIKFDLTSIKQEHMSQSDEDSCVIDQDRTTSGKDTTSNEMYNASMASCDLNLLANINNQSRHAFKSSFDQTSQHSSNSPGASSLGSPRGASCVQSPPSSSQGILGVPKMRTYICECGKAFRTPHGFSAHKQKHLGIYRFYCSICNKGCSDRNQLEGHMNKHSNLKPFTCEKCYKSFGFKSALYRHTLLVHNSSAWKHENNTDADTNLYSAVGDKYICNKINCRREFKTYTGIRQHVMSHIGIYRYPCTICSKGCTSTRQLEGHMNSHSNSRPYKCDMCEKCFPFKSSLSRHKKKGCAGAAKV